eukprot:CAMPEP_0119550348 /NCGR_PEP_ID=MMETSP1352-20130426/3875_1 /TAXON_ID=265584 /ORGANISM="Stauroneis constricta, Strain CCMP1120" /LENGTH=855 /DNA_ID=CAMNT_0007596159 /DNA_START=276 /DNA_END=2843 /DNA_ORIENTATION=+
MSASFIHSHASTQAYLSATSGRGKRSGVLDPALGDSDSDDSSVSLPQSTRKRPARSKPRGDPKDERNTTLSTESTYMETSISSSQDDGNDDDGDDDDDSSVSTSRYALHFDSSFSMSSDDDGDGDDVIPLKGCNDGVKATKQRKKPLVHFRKANAAAANVGGGTGIAANPISKPNVDTNTDVDTNANANANANSTPNTPNANNTASTPNTGNKKGVLGRIRKIEKRCSEHTRSSFASSSFHGSDDIGMDSNDGSSSSEDEDDDDDDDVVMTAFEKFRQMSIKSPSTPKPNAATTGGNGNDNNHSISPFNSTHSAPAPISSSFASPKPHTPINSYSQHTPRKSPFTTPQQQHQRKHTYGSRRFSSSSASISSASSATSSLVPPAFQATMLASPPIFSKQPLKRDGSQSTTPRRLNHHRWSSLGSTTNTPTGSFHSISTNGTITTDEEDEDDMDDATDEKVTSTPLSAYRDRFRRSSSVADLVNNFSSPKPTGDTKISTPKTAPTTTTSSPMRRKIKFERKPDHDSNVPSLFRAPPLAFDTKPKQKNEPKTVYKDGKKFTVTATSNSRRLGGTVKKATVTKKMTKKSSASSTDAIKKKSASKDKKSSSRSTSKSNKSSSEPPGVVSFTTKPSDYEDSFVKLNSEPIVPKLSPRLTWKEQQQKRRQAQKGGSATPKQRHSSSSSMSSRDLPKSKKRISKRSSTTAMPSNTSSNRFAKNSNKIDTPSGRASVVMLNEKAPQIQQRPTTPTKLSKESVSNIFKNTDAHSLSKPCPFTTTKKAIKKQKPLKSALRRKTALSTTTATINVTFSAEIETTHTVQDTRKIPGVSFESLFYTDEELARFRHEQFCEEIGVDPDEY